MEKGLRTLDIHVTRTHSRVVQMPNPQVVLVPAFTNQSGRPKNNTTKPKFCSALLETQLKNALVNEIVNIGFLKAETDYLSPTALSTSLVNGVTSTLVGSYMSNKLMRPF